MKKTLYMMRHGQTLFNELNRIQGWCDSPLTELGIRQAKGARKYFVDNGIIFDHAYSSTAERACDTLEIVTGYSMPYKRIKGLKEMNFGKFEGQSETLNPPRDIFEDFFLDFGGESRSNVRRRLYETNTQIMEEDNQVVLVVSHAGACAHFLSVVEGINRLNEERKKGFSNCTILKYSYENNKFHLEDVIRPEPLDDIKENVIV